MPAMAPPPTIFGGNLSEPKGGPVNTQSTQLSRGLCITLVVIALGALAACGGVGDDRPRVDTQHGTVIGVDRAEMQSFFAIPFAAPPTGERRWQPPADPASWPVPRAAEASAAPCLQTGASPFRLQNDSEDCLYLDVHRPAGGGIDLPVLVWFHGGAFNTGGSITWADPSPMVRNGVIVVNVAYRLGAMGFLGHPALEGTGGQVGNYGIMDQQAALRWIRANIAGFGGDRNNVTIFGESAGGFSVMTHLASPLSAGLFDKAIVMSGNYSDSQPTAATLRSASTTVVDNALRAAGITCPGGTVTAQCLRELPESVVRNQLAVAFNQIFPSPVPAVDGVILPKTVRQAFVDGDNHRVPVINGTTLDEWSLFVAIRELSQPPIANTQAAFAAYVGATFGNPAWAAAYPISDFDNNSSLAATALGTALVFSCRALRATQRMANQVPAQPVFMYEFRDRTALPSISARADGTPISFAQGAGHSYELQYLFNLRPLANDEQRALQTAMATYWTNFARTGNPNLGRSVPATWPQFAGTGPTSVLGLDVASRGGVATLATPFETTHRCNSTWSFIAF